MSNDLPTRIRRIHHILSNNGLVDTERVIECLADAAAALANPPAAQPEGHMPPMAELPLLLAKLDSETRALICTFAHMYGRLCAELAALASRPVVAQPAAIAAQAEIDAKLGLVALPPIRVDEATALRLQQAAGAKGLIVQAYVRELIAAQAAQPVAWQGGEEWEPLAWALCAEECGEDACNELIWEGGPQPEPWGDRWMKYEPEAKRMIELVRKHVALAASAPSQAELETKFSDIRALLEETYRFASTSPLGQRNINEVLSLLDEIDSRDGNKETV